MQPIKRWRVKQLLFATTILLICLCSFMGTEVKAAGGEVIRIDCSTLSMYGGTNGDGVYRENDVSNGKIMYSFDNTAKLTLSEGFSFELENCTNAKVQCIDNKGTIMSGNIETAVYNSGTIEAGSFSRMVVNETGGIINGGTFAIGVENNAVINGGIFSSYIVNNNANGLILGGTFYSDVYNNAAGIIRGGTFYTPVRNNAGGTITEGIFETFVSNAGTIKGGDFSEDVQNENIIMGGTFHGQVVNSNENSYIARCTLAAGSRLICVTGTMERVTLENGGTIINGSLPPFTTPGTWSLSGGEYVVPPAEITEDTSEKEARAFTNDLLTRAAAAKPGDTLKIDATVWHSFSANVLKELFSKEGVNYTFYYNYGGECFYVDVPQGAELEEGIDWYGPLKLNAMFGRTMIQKSEFDATLFK